MEQPPTAIPRTKHGQAKIDQKLPLTTTSTRFSYLLVRDLDVELCVTGALHGQQNKSVYNSEAILFTKCFISLLNYETFGVESHSQSRISKTPILGVRVIHPKVKVKTKTKVNCCCEVLDIVLLANNRSGVLTEMDEFAKRNIAPGTDLDFKDYVKTQENCCQFRPKSSTCGRLMMSAGYIHIKK